MAGFIKNTVVVSKPGAVLRVERVELTEEGHRALTTRVRELGPAVLDRRQNQAPQKADGTGVPSAAPDHGQSPEAHGTGSVEIG